MKRLRFWLSGGLLLCGSPLALAQGEGYIDLEAERAQQRTQQRTQQEVPPPGEPEGYPGYAPAPGQAAVPSSIGDVYYQLQLLQREVMELRGRVEEQEYQIRQLQQQSLERYQDLDQRLSQAPSGGGSGAAGAAAPSPVAPLATAPVVRELPGEGDAYRAAYSLVRSREFAGAVAAFREFLQDFPSGHFAPNAHYWLGELYLVVEPKDLESSRREFVLLVDQYPENAKAPDALYKLGKIHFEKGNRERAREYLDRALREYGDSGSAAIKLARDFLNQNFQSP